MFTAYKGAAKRLDDIDIPKLGAEIGVGEDELHAFMEVESAGAGFDVQGRVKMLFEPHVFYRELGPGKKRDRAVKEKLAYAKWAPGGYPADSYPRLKAAMQIDETAALRSASWGLGQVMGFNHVVVGYATPQAMVRAFADDEEHQLRAVVDFLKAKGLASALKTHNWLKIERVYNGGGFKGAYAARMQAAYDRWQKIKDTAWEPEQQLPQGIVLDPPPEIEPAAEETPPPTIEPIAEPASAPSAVASKPVLKHRRVWTTIMGFVGGGSAFSLASLAAFEWQSIAVIIGAAVAVGLFFWFVYKKEIDAGMFGPEVK